MRRAGPFGIRLPRAVGAAILGSCALALVSCGTPKYEYLQDESLGAYFKVPHDWTVIDEDQLLDGAGLSPTDLAVQKQFGWAVAAASRLVRQPDGSVAVDSAQPLVVVRVWPLTQAQHDVLSNKVMENWIVDLSQVPASDYEMLGTGSAVLDGGYHGIQRMYQLRRSDGTYTNHLEQVLTNPRADRVYTLSIVCTPECFTTYGNDIQEVFGSWTIKEP